MGKLVKQPNEKTRYQLVFDLGTDTITSVDATIVASRGLVAEVAPLTAVAGAPTGASVEITLDGGTDQELYAVAVAITTAAGDKVEDNFDVHLVDFTFQAPDGDAAAYVTPIDYIDRYGLDETIDLTDEAGIGRVDRRVLLRGLKDASLIVDGYLSKRYTTPLSAPIPDVIQRLTAEIARYILHRHQAPDGVEKRYKEANTALRDYANGAAVLPATESVATGTGSPVVSADKRIWTKDTLEGF